MSDTPRMKAANMAAMEHCTGDVWRVGCDLERELNAAKVEIERLRKANLQLREGAEEQKQRIKRLEQLGDALANVIDENCDPTFANDVTRWRKNKEAKP